MISSPTRCLIILALVVVGADLHSEASSQTKPINKAASGSISGRITLQGKGKAGIVVGLNTMQGPPRQGPILKATTDAEGNYRITEIPGGFYYVTPLAPAFVMPDLVANAFSQRGKALHLAEGETVEDIDFSILRGAVITGKVTYADGRAVIEEPIFAMHVDQNQRGLFSQGFFQTDDRGVYRIFGLPAGRYRVSVGQADDSYFNINRARPPFERVFYPDVSDVNEARVIELAEGGEAANIDITVGKSIQGFAVTGQVVDGETNQPLANLRFGLQRTVRDRNAYIGAPSASNQQGEFRIENLPPGKYAVIVMPQRNSQVQADPVPFEVIDQDVTGIIVRTSKGATISGAVVVEGTADKSVLSRIARLRLQSYILSDSAAGPFSQDSPINPDGSFRIGGLQAGIANFSLISGDYSPPTGFSISRVEREGVVVPRGVEIKSGEQVSGVKVFVNYGTGIVRGTLHVENGPLPPGAQLTVRLMKPGESAYGLRAQTVDARGHFIIEGVAAGSYDLFVNAFVPGSRQGPTSVKQSITVADGAATDVDLSIDLNPKRDSPSP